MTGDVGGLASSDSKRLIGEFLSGDGRLVHQAALCDGEHSHSLVVATDGIGVVLSAARTGSGATRPRARRGSRSDRDRARVGAELEIAGGELIQCSFVLEEDDLTVSLTAELEAHADLGHRGGSDELSLRIDAAGSMGRSDYEPALANGREDRIAIAVRKEAGALSGILEKCDRRGVRLARVTDTECQKGKDGCN